MERKFSNRIWGDVVNKFGVLSKNRRFLNRFRFDYYAFVFKESSFKDSFKEFIINIAGFGSEIRYILVFQLRRSRKLSATSKHVIHLSDSNSFLKTILPIGEMLLENGVAPVFLCQANHYKKLASQLGPRITESLVRYEEIQMYTGKAKAFLHIVRAFFFTICDVAWFVFVPLKHRFSTAFSFGRHSFVHHYSDKFWKRYFSTEKRMFIAAEDQYLWEAALFDNIHATPSLSFVFQHGKLSDIYYPTAAKQFCAFGIIDFNRIVNEFRATPSEVLDVGSPYYDAIYNQYRSHQVQANEERKYVIFFAQPWYRVSASRLAHYLFVLNWFYGLSTNKMFLNYKFVLKLHPQDFASFYADRPSNIEIALDNLMALIEKSLFTLTLDSSTIFEAAFCGIPSIQTIPRGAVNIFTDESYSGISMKATTYNELETIALKLLKNQGFYQQSVRELEQALNMYFSNIGHSMDVIRDLLLDKGNKL